MIILVPKERQYMGLISRFLCSWSWVWQKTGPTRTNLENIRTSLIYAFVRRSDYKTILTSSPYMGWYSPYFRNALKQWDRAVTAEQETHNIEGILIYQVNSQKWDKQNYLGDESSPKNVWNISSLALHYFSSASERVAVLAAQTKVTQINKQ